MSSNDPQFWLMKSEPDVYSINDLEKEKNCFWEGIRNYQVRNFIRNNIKKNDLAFFYHSNAKPPGISGLMKIIKEAYPDHTAFDPKSKYFDKKSDPNNPRWWMFDVEFVHRFDTILSLEEIKKNSHLFPELMVIKKGSRLSIQPLTKKDFLTLCQLAQTPENIIKIIKKEKKEQ